MPSSPGRKRRGHALRGARGRSLVTVGRHCTAAGPCARAAGQPGARQCRPDVRARAAARLRARAGRVLPRSGPRHRGAAGCGAVRARREPGLRRARRHGFRAALREACRCASTPGCTSTRRRAISNWHLPLPHALEDWSDARSPDGRATIIQPVVQPLYDSRSLHAIVAGADVRRAPLGARPRAADLGAAARRRCGVGGRAQDRLHRRCRTAAPAPASTAPPRACIPPPADGELEIVIRPDPTIRDGSFANNAWLQELPKPLFKTTWENVVAISPRLARDAAASTAATWCGSKAAAARSRARLGACRASPNGVVTLFLGYGRRRAGRRRHRHRL